MSPAVVLAAPVRDDSSTVDRPTSLWLRRLLLLAALIALGWLLSLFAHGSSARADTPPPPNVAARLGSLTAGVDSTLSGTLDAVGQVAAAAPGTVSAVPTTVDAALGRLASPAGGPRSVVRSSTIASAQQGVSRLTASLVDPVDAVVITPVSRTLTAVADQAASAIGRVGEVPGGGSGSAGAPSTASRPTVIARSAIGSGPLTDSSRRPGVAASSGARPGVGGPVSGPIATPGPGAASARPAGSPLRLPGPAQPVVPSGPAPGAPGPTPTTSCSGGPASSDVVLTTFDRPADVAVTTTSRVDRLPTSPRADDRTFSPD